MNVEFHNANQGEYITIDGNLLTSPYSVEDEIKRFLNKINKDLRSTTIIIFGLGLGTYVNKLEHMLHPSNFIVIVEPQHEILERCKGSGQMVKSKRIYYINATPDEVIAILDINKINSRFKVVYGYMNYRNVFRNQFKELVESIRNDSVMKLGNEATLTLYDKEFTINIFKNYFFHEFHLPINALKGAYKDIPALIISAGPSLEKHIDMINSFQGLIFSGGRTILEFLKKEIRVDFMISVDPTDRVYELVEGADCIGKMPTLITYLESNHKVVEHHNSKKIIMNSPTAPILLGLGEELDIIETGPSVSNVAVSIAQYLGCDPIVFIGQDLSFTDGKHHADISVMKFDQEIETRYLTIEVDGYYNNKVRTSPSFYSMLKWFEDWINQHNGTYINATEGGVSIHGCKKMPFKAYLDEQVKLPFVLQNKFESICENTPIFKAKLNISAYVNKIQNLNKIIKKMVFHSQKIIECVKSENKSNLNQHISALSKLEVKIDNEMNGDQLLNYLFASAFFGFENGKRRISKNDNLSTACNNLQFYQSLSENIQHLMSWLKENKND